MTPVEMKSWYMEMRLAGHTQDEILKLFQERTEAELEARQEVRLKAAAAKLAHFQAVTSSWTRGLEAARAAGDEEGTIEMIEAGTAALRRDTHLLKEAGKTVKDELAREAAIKKVATAELKALQAKPKPPLFYMSPYTKWGTPR